MNFSFYMFGTPNGSKNGYMQYPNDSTAQKFQEFALHATGEAQLTVWRKEQLSYYVYVRQLQNGNADYFGFCLVFNGIYCTNPEKLLRLFDLAFSYTVQRGELLRVEHEKPVYALSDFTQKLPEIERITKFFKNELDTDFEADFAVTPAAFAVGNGGTTISKHAGNKEILSAIAQYDYVHIAENRQSQPQKPTPTPTPLQPEKKHKPKKVPFLFLIGITISAIIMGIYYFSQKTEQEKDTRTVVADVEHETPNTPETRSNSSVRVVTDSEPETPNTQYQNNSEQPVVQITKNEDNSEEKIINKANTAFDNGNHTQAYQLYVEAANKSINAAKIKRNAAEKFRLKAQNIINTLGECDEISKELLQYAQKLYPSEENQTLLDICPQTKK